MGLDGAGSFLTLREPFGNLAQSLLSSVSSSHHSHQSSLPVHSPVALTTQCPQSLARLDWTACGYTLQVGTVWQADAGVDWPQNVMRVCTPPAALLQQTDGSRPRVGDVLWGPVDEVFVYLKICNVAVVVEGHCQVFDAGNLPGLGDHIACNELEFAFWCDVDLSKRTIESLCPDVDEPG